MIPLFLVPYAIFFHALSLLSLRSPRPMNTAADPEGTGGGEEDDPGVPVGPQGMGRSDRDQGQGPKAPSRPSRSWKSTVPEPSLSNGQGESVTLRVP